MKCVREITFIILNTALLGILSLTGAIPDTIFKNNLRRNGSFAPPAILDQDLDDDGIVEIYSKTGEVCLQAHLNMQINIDDDRFHESEENTSLLDFHQIHVRTANFHGLCAGEKGILGGRNVTGPAIVFYWNDTFYMDQVSLLWKVQNDQTTLDSVKIKLTVPVYPGAYKYKNLYADISDLNMFPSPVGSSAVIFGEAFRINFTGPDNGLFIFKDGDYIIGAVVGISLLAFILSATILVIIMIIGVIFYNRGGRKKRKNLITVQT